MENLAKKAEVDFLSDLHYGLYWPDIYYALQKMEAEDYTLEEWEEAVKYILGEENASFGTPEAACLYLLKRLEKFTIA